MSTSINHHYVSQCQIRNFFNKEKGKIFLYDKRIDNIFTKITTKSIFSEREINSTLIDGEVNHNMIEKDLKDYFEDCFSKNVAIIENYVNTQVAETEIIRNALYELTQLGIIGELRNPVRKREFENNLFKPFEEIAKQAAEPLKQQLEQLFEDRSKTKFSNKLVYSKMAGEILDKMKPITSIIYSIETDDYFLLSDCSSFTARAKINNYFNPDIKEIADVSIPLTSKLMLRTFSSKHDKQPGGIFYLSEEYKQKITDINRKILATAEYMVACENQTYLESFIEETKIDFTNKGFDISKSYRLG